MMNVKKFMKNYKCIKIITGLIILMATIALTFTTATVKAVDTPTGDDTYEVKIELNTVSSKDNSKLGGNTLRVTEVTDEESNLQIDLFRAQSGDRITTNQDGTFTSNSDGTIISLTNLIKNETYHIKIEDIEATEGYQTTLNSLVLDVFINDDGNTVASISQMTGKNGQITDLINQVIAKLQGANSQGVVTIDPSAGDENAAYKYKIGEDGDWTNYKGEFKVYQNTTVYAQASKNGISSNVSIKLINNIDKELPQLESYTEINENEERYSSLNIKLTDNASGIVKYGISTSNIEEPDEYIQANQELELETTIDEVYENGPHYVWIWDAAGNCAQEEVNLEKVKIVDVAKITAATEGYESLIGTTYTTLEAAIAACPTAENSTATISIINDILNENNQINNRTITLNMNGYTITNKSSTKPALTINGGSSLTIINEDETGKALNDGLIISKNSEGVKVKENGTLTLGKDDKRIRKSQPAVQGKNNGVVTEGTFNFYDGQIIGTLPEPNEVVIAIDGTESDKPAAYSIFTEEPVSETESKQIATLAIIKGIEAQIGRKTYTKLETAVEEAGTVFGTDGSQVEITIVTDLNKDDTVIIDGSKNIKLDLNGYSYTTKSSGYVIENYGELEIVDTSEEKTGEIVGTTNSAVHNMTHDIKGEVNEVDLSTVGCHATSGWGGIYKFQLTEDGLRASAGDYYYTSPPWGDLEIDLTEYEGKQCVINVDAETVTENYQTYRRYFKIIHFIKNWHMG